MTSIKDWLFPTENRNFPAKRWVKISLRTLHLVGLAGMGSGFLYAVPIEAWLPYFWLMLMTGWTMLLIDVWTNGVCLMQLRTHAIILKLLILFFIFHWQMGWSAGFIVIILISGVISHAPSKIRYYSIWHRRQIEQL